MSDPAYIPNHTVDPATGFLESNGFLQAFDAEKKVSFLKLFYDNGLKLYRTCAELGIKAETVHKHVALDPVFKDAFDQVKRDYYDELEGISRINALNPRSVIERIFQLKAAFPEKYGDGKRDSGTTVNITIDPAVIEMAKKRALIVDAEIIPSTPEKIAETIENQSPESASNEAVVEAIGDNTPDNGDKC